MLSCANSESGERMGGPENSTYEGSETGGFVNTVGNQKRRLRRLQGHIASANHENFALIVSGIRSYGRFLA